MGDMQNPPSTDRLHADHWPVQPVGSFRRGADGHQSLAGPLSFPCRVALDLLLPHRCPDHVPSSTAGTEFGIGRSPAATSTGVLPPRFMEPHNAAPIVILC